MLPLIHWPTVAAVTGITTTLIGIIAWLFKPHCGAFVWKTIEADPNKYDALRRESVTRDAAHQAAVIRDALASELKCVEITTRLVDAHDESIKFVRATLLQQGEELRQLPTIASALKSNADAMIQLTVTMKEIHIEVSRHSKRFERWEGYMEGKTEGDREASGNRRLHKRRSGDPPPDDLF